MYSKRIQKPIIYFEKLKLTFEIIRFEITGLKDSKQVLSLIKIDFVVTVIQG